MQRRGYMLLWVLTATALVLLLGGGAMFALSSAVHREGTMERRGDAVFLAQEVMETMKTNVRFHKNLSVPTGAVTRNGRTYFVETGQEMVTVEGVLLRRLFCTVRSGKDSYSLSVLVGGAP